MFSFVTAEDAFDLPALSIQVLKESFFHLAAVFCFGPFSRGFSAFNRDQTVRLEFIADQLVKSFGVTATVPEHPAKLDPAVGRSEHLGGFDRIPAGSQADMRTHDQVGIDVCAEGELGPAWDTKTFQAAAGAEVK